MAKRGGLKQSPMGKGKPGMTCGGKMGSGKR
jgi:hypothetical protein